MLIAIGKKTYLYFYVEVTNGNACHYKIHQPSCLQNLFFFLYKKITLKFS